MAKTSRKSLINEVLRHDLLAFIERVFYTINPGDTFQSGWHLEAITHALHENRMGHQPRLIITQPPRSLKSISVSVAYVAWMLGHDPSLKFICVSYSSDLASDLARQFRDVMKSDWYRAVFPNVKITKDSADETVTSKNGGRLTTSIGGTLTGRGADIILIDDPLKSDDAQSEIARKKVIDWYRGTLISRLNNQTTGKIVLTMQRLHEEDLAGYLLEQDNWAHLDLPAIAQETQRVAIGPDQFRAWPAGELLHPALLPQEVLDNLKADMGSQAFSAVYLQRPVPVDGNMVRRQWLKTFCLDDLVQEDDDYIVQSWDTALKAGENNDYSVCTTWLVRGQDYYLVDVLREKMEFPQLCQRAKDHSKFYDVEYVLVEDKGSGKSLIQELKADRGTIYPIAIEPEGDKKTRMYSETPAIERGQVFIPDEAEWLSAFMRELLAFPNGRHDDQVDSMSQFLRWAKDHYLKRPAKNLNVTFGGYRIPSY